MEQHLHMNGSDIFVKTLGEGEPIIFLHGGPGSEHRFFLPYMEGLSNDYYLVFYDQRGCGKSQTVDHYTIDEEVETLEQLRITLGLDTINLFGESWGSMLALLYATKYPQNVDRIILTAAIGVTTEGLEVFGKELEKRVTDQDAAKLKRLEKDIENGEANIESLFEILDPYYVHSASSLNRKSNINMKVNELMSEDIKVNYDLRSKLSSLSTIPILIAQGESDMISPNHVKQLLIKHIPHATLHSIKQCGHWTVIECPEVIKQLTREFIG